MAAMMLMLINFNNGCVKNYVIAAICWLPPLISQLFSPRYFNFFSQYSCFCAGKGIFHRIRCKGDILGGTHHFLWDSYIAT